MTISKSRPAYPAMDYELLREEGLQYIEQFASNLWTDYNAHDPGITILEILSYAITDLGYRISLPIQDLLAAEASTLEDMHRQFLSAKKVLSGCAVTAQDYRKLFIDIPEIKNIWLKKATPKLLVDCKKSEILKAFDPETDVVQQYQKLITLNGFYKVLVELEEENFDDAAKANILQKIKALYHANRNLCEDIDEQIDFVEEEEMIVCTDIELENEADIETVLAQMLFDIQEYLTPTVRRYTLKELLEKGRTSEEIFDGPFLENGFIDNEELQNSELRDKVYVSDLIQVLMKIEGVKSVKSILLNFCDCDSDVPTKTANEKWVLDITDGKKPVLCRGKSIFNFFKGLLPFRPDEDLVSQKLADLHAAEFQKNEAIAQAEDDLKMPTGKFRAIQKYHSFQNDFPEAYGIGRDGLPGNPSDERRVKAKQLKGYLLFFDQILANYFAQLANTKELLANTSDNEKSYFFQRIKKKDLKGIEEIVSDFPGFQGVLRDLENEKINGQPSQNNVARRNKIYDHLLARFAENFNEYVLLMHQMFGRKRAGVEILKDKKLMLQEYDQLSCRRALGIDYVNKFYKKLDGTPHLDEAETPIEKKVWYAANEVQPENFNWNTAGIQHRIARLIGMENFHNRNLVDDKDENMFLIEHSLLRPRKSGDNFLSICTELDCSTCAPLDPYSFRVSIVLPGKTDRFQNIDFRKFAENTIRAELPAHILAKICWIHPDQMTLFEEKYREWMNYQQGRLDGDEIDEANNSLNEFIEILNQLVTIFEKGTLHDCEDGNDQNPIILGRTQIGSL